MKLRVLHYTGVYAPAWKWGGPPRSSANLAEGTAALGHEVTVYTTNAGLEDDPNIPTDRPVLRNGVTVHYFPARTSLLGLRSAEMENAVRRRAKDFDVVHITGVWQPTSVAACRACEALGVPYVISPRGALSPYSFSQKAWKKWPYWWMREQRNCNFASIVHYTATMEKDECARLKLRGRPVVIPNSIDFSSWWGEPEAGRAWRSQLRPVGVIETTKVLLYAGRQHHKKGLDLLPEVLLSLPNRNWHLVLVGSDEDGSGAALVKAFGEAKAKVTCLPATDAAGLRAAYSGADIFVLPSRHENFGNVVVEALACGCPVIVSDAVGAADQIQDIPGVTVVPRTKKEWQDAIERQLRSAVKPPSDIVMDRFSCKGVARSMSAVYESCVKTEAKAKNLNR